jgi:hypothetical protein
MGQIGPTPIDGNVHVMPHAVEQARARFKSYDGKDDATVAASIAADVRDAMSRGLVYDERPRGFYVIERHRHGGGGLMPLGQRFVMHPSQDKGWVISFAARVAGDVEVVTTLRRIERQR